MPEYKTIWFAGVPYDVSLYNGRPYYHHGNVFLHREIWASIHGPVPEGYEVHHKDNNPVNNDPMNLEAMSKADHARHHVCLDICISNIDGAFDKWKATPHYKICEGCGITFQCGHAHAKFCCQKCKNDATTRKRKELTRPKDRNCLNCGLLIHPERNTKKYCSDKCKSQYLNRRKNENVKDASVARF